jgi:hypothetical protein
MSPSFCATPAAIHLLYRRRTDPSTVPRPSLSFTISSALLRRVELADLGHLLSLPSYPLTDVFDVLSHVLTIIEAQTNGLSAPLMWRALGFALEVYR